MEEIKIYIVPMSKILVPAVFLNSYGDNDGLIDISRSRMDPEDMCANESTFFEDETSLSSTSVWDE